MLRIGIVGAGHVFNAQIEAIKLFSQFKLSAVCDINRKKLLNIKNMEIYTTQDYKKLLDLCDIIFISVPPKAHFKIALFFLKHNKKVIIEKPIVISIKELIELEPYSKNIYNSLHYSFGKEVEWFIKNWEKEKPLKIKAYISDKYVENEAINRERLSLNGAYLDETINPLSAICKIYGYDISCIEINKEYDKYSSYDYYAVSKFLINNIEVEVEIEWRSNNDEKYIDIYFKNRIVRLDSMKQSVIDLGDNSVYFKADGDRLVNHYSGVLADYAKINNNFNVSKKLHRGLLNEL